MPKERYTHVVLSGVLSSGSPVDFDLPALREPLIEHIGHLPIIASYLYPHITHHVEVDLGRALIMLSIHDIGETITGDTITYQKSNTHEEEERAAALRLIHTKLLPYYEEFEARESPTARFAKSVDSLAPILHEMDMPRLTRLRFQHFGWSTDAIIAKKRPAHLWDPVLLAIFDLLMEQYRRIEAGEPSLFAPSSIDEPR
jgi:hypothetical protein